MSNNLDKPLSKITIGEIFQQPPLYHNVAADIAEHATSLLLGQGYSVDILRNDKKDEKLEKAWKKVERRSKFTQLLERNEYDLSYLGFKILTIDKTEAGDIVIMENDPHYYNKVSTFQQIDEISAVVWKRIQIDQSTWSCREFWTNKKVERQWYYRATSAGNDVVVTDELRADIPPELNLPKEWHHNLGILPVKLMVNKNRNITQLYEYYELSDTYTARNQIRMLNMLTNQQVKEALLNVTKVFGQFDQSTRKKIAKQYGVDNDAELQLLLNQLFIEIKNTGDMTSSSKPVEILQANPAFEKYILAREDAFRNIWRAAGYTYNAAGETTNSNAETLYANAFDIRTTKKKKTTRQQDYADLIAKCLVALGEIKWEDYTSGEVQIIFNIKENAVQTPNQISDNEIKLIDAGLKSRARALMKIDGIPTIEQAEELIREADEDVEAQQERLGEELENRAGVGENSEMTKSIEPRGEAA